MVVRDLPTLEDHENLVKAYADKCSLIERIQSALGTAETGDNLVAVARDACKAERAHAALLRENEDNADCQLTAAIEFLADKMLSTEEPSMDYDPYIDTLVLAARMVRHLNAPPKVFELSKEDAEKLSAELSKGNDTIAYMMYHDAQKDAVSLKFENDYYKRNVVHYQPNPFHVDDMIDCSEFPDIIVGPLAPSGCCRLGSDCNCHDDEPTYADL